jgi:hypothetical protein
MHVLALQVLDDAGFAGGLVIERDDMRRDRCDLGEAGGAQWRRAAAFVTPAFSETSARRQHGQQK